jgi:hypothetical protein
MIDELIFGPPALMTRPGSRTPVLISEDLYLCDYLRARNGQLVLTEEDMAVGDEFMACLQRANVLRARQESSEALLSLLMDDAAARNPLIPRDPDEEVMMQAGAAGHLQMEALGSIAPPGALLGENLAIEEALCRLAPEDACTLYCLVAPTWETNRITQLVTTAMEGTHRFSGLPRSNHPLRCIAEASPGIFYGPILAGALKTYNRYNAEDRASYCEPHRGAWPAYGDRLLALHMPTKDEEQEEAFVTELIRVVSSMGMSDELMHELSNLRALRRQVRGPDAVEGHLNRAMYEHRYWPHAHHPNLAHTWMEFAPEWMREKILLAVYY